MEYCLGGSLHTWDFDNNMQKLCLNKILEGDGANEIFGNIYCEGNHWTIDREASQLWNCKLCGESDIKRDTEVLVICNSCANLTGRCQNCGKLEK